MNQTLILLGAAVALAALLGWWVWRQRGATTTTPPPGRSERFAAVAAISPVQRDLLQYLVDAFAGRPVLFRVPLSQLVTVRGSDDRLRTQRRLAEQWVDYVVCDREGKPMFAFELDAVHEDTEQAAQDAAEKHRVLQSAGIRLIRVKRSTRDMPPPREFRRLMQAAAIEPGATDSQRAPLKPPRARPAVGVAPPVGASAHETIPMSLTDLMGLEPNTDAFSGEAPAHRRTPRP